MPTETVTIKYHSTSGKLGADPSTSSGTTAEFNLGERDCFSNGTLSYDAIYVLANGAITANAFVKIDDDYQVTEVTTAISGSEPTRVGCAQVALADNEYGWVAVNGTFTGLMDRDWETRISHHS